MSPEQVEALPSVVAGAVLLLFGRRLFWLAVGLAGFLLGYALVLELAADVDRVLAVAAGVVTGLAGALLAVFFHQLALAVGGLLLGGYGVHLLALRYGVEPEAARWVLVAVGAVAGALLLRLVFEAALILLSAVLGAVLVLTPLEWEDPRRGLLFLGVVAFGALFQLFVVGRRRSAGRGRETG